jgi:hypothetical protein
LHHIKGTGIVRTPSGSGGDALSRTTRAGPSSIHDLERTIKAQEVRSRTPMKSSDTSPMRSASQPRLLTTTPTAQQHSIAQQQPRSLTPSSSQPRQLTPSRGMLGGKVSTIQMSRPMLKKVRFVKIEHILFCLCLRCFILKFRSAYHC